MEPSTRVVSALECLKHAFLDRPDVRVSMTDAIRISGLEAHLCQGVLAALEDVRFLTRVDDGTYRKTPANICD